MCTVWVEVGVKPKVHPLGAEAPRRNEGVCTFFFFTVLLIYF